MAWIVGVALIAMGLAGLLPAARADPPSARDAAGQTANTAKDPFLETARRSLRFTPLMRWSWHRTHPRLAKALQFAIIIPWRPARPKLQE